MLYARMEKDIIGMRGNGKEVIEKVHEIGLNKWKGSMVSKKILE